jgi:hypothetical protein
VAGRAIVLQQKTQRPVQFEITPSTREVVTAWIKQAGLNSNSYLFSSRVWTASSRKSGVATFILAGALTHDFCY